MIRHIIMFKFTYSDDEQDKELKAKKMKETFSPLKSKIDVIQTYDIGINSKNTDFSYDLAITSTFNSWDDLENYIKHPEHQKAIKVCSDIKKEKAVVDYEF